MKTAISLPDNIFIEIEKTAKSLNISRSKIFTIAAEEFLLKYKSRALQNRMNSFYDNNPSLSNELEKAHINLHREILEEW